MPIETRTIAPSQPKSAPAKARTKVGFVSLGCPKNLVDSEVMMGLLETGGAQITEPVHDFGQAAKCANR